MPLADSPSVLNPLRREALHGRVGEAEVVQHDVDGEEVGAATLEAIEHGADRVRVHQQRSDRPRRSSRAHGELQENSTRHTNTRKLFGASLE